MQKRKAVTREDGADMYRQRRQDLMRAMGDDAVAVVPTAPQRTRSKDVMFRFRPDNDFYYLTHFPEPEALAVLVPGREEGEFVLFCRPRDARAEAWEGRREGPEEACKRYGADQAFSIEEVDKRLPGLLAGKSKVFAPLGREAGFTRRLFGWVNAVRTKQREGVQVPATFVELGHITHEFRVAKEEGEQLIMRRAGWLSAAGHERGMRACAPGQWEYTVQAEVECEFTAGGGRVAYPSIVAGGANACVLHYTSNDCKLQDGELVLVDAGAELDCYAGDVTRTYPVNGVFSGPQRALYEVVLAAQKAAIEVVKVGETVRRYDEVATEVLTDGLLALGLLKGEREELVKKKAYQRFTMHGAGHWLGMDVHDVGDYKVDGEWRALEAGMVVTVEPGLYVPAAEDVDERWWGMGVRIEDDVFVMKHGHEILSVGVVKEMDEIEAVMRGE